MNQKTFQLVNQILLLTVKIYEKYRSSYHARFKTTPPAECELSDSGESCDSLK